MRDVASKGQEGNGLFFFVLIGLRKIFLSSSSTFVGGRKHSDGVISLSFPQVRCHSSSVTSPREKKKPKLHEGLFKLPEKKDKNNPSLLSWSSPLPLSFLRSLYYSGKKKKITPSVQKN